MGQVVGVLGAGEIGPPDRPEQDRPTGERAGHRPRSGVGHDVGHVVGRVPRRGDDGDPQRAGDDLVAVGHAESLEGDLLGGGHDVGGARLPGQGEAARDIVVVNVRLADVGDPHAEPNGQGQDPVDVALRVDHDGHLPVGGQVRPVSQARGVDDVDVDPHNASSRA